MLLPMLDTAIGIVLVLFVFTSLCSAGAEIVAGARRTRARFLEQGIRRLLARDDLVTAFYAHPLIRALSPAGGQHPSYIPREQFAHALLDIASVASGGRELLRSPQTLLQALPQGSAVRELLEPLLQRAGDDVERAVAGVERLYDDAMDRVSGWYRRHVQGFLLLFGLGAAVVFNVDAVNLVHTLSTNDGVRAALLAAAQQEMRSPPPTRAPPGRDGIAAPSVYRPAPGAAVQLPPAAVPAAPPVPASATLPSAAPAAGDPGAAAPAGDVQWDRIDRLRATGIPIGWSLTTDARDPRAFPVTPAGVLLKALGILLTAVAGTMGASFWFDVLSRLMMVRSTLKPKETEKVPAR